METFLQFAFLGLGSGCAYAIASLGLVQIHRGSGVLNLAHGAIAYGAAALFVATWRDGDWPLALALPFSIAAAAVLGFFIELVVMGPLSNAAPLVRMTATLGVFAALQQGVPLVFGDDIATSTVGTFYPTGTVSIGDVRIGYDRIILVAITIGLAAILWLLSARTRYGMATTAVAENHLVASTMGVARRVVASLNWSLGAALAGTAGVLLLPVIGVAAAPPLLFLVIPALAAAMIGRFASFGLTVAGGLGLGIGESLLVRYQADIFPDDVAFGWPKALPFLVIVGLLIARGTPFPSRVETATLLPRVRDSGVSTPCALGAIVVAALATTQASDQLAGRISSSAGLAIVGVSLVVVIGYAGQTSLAQMALAGVGALIAARISSGLGWPFVVVIVVAVVLSAAVGTLVALPSLRTRGPTLAIATLGVGIALEQVVLTSGILTLGGFSGTPVERPTLFGYAVDNISHPQRYAVMSVLALGLVCWGVAILRSGRVGRRLLAVRGGERAAASLGVSIAASKLGAFAIASAIAGLGGVLLGFRGDSVTYSQFGLLPSLNLIVFSLIGGIGYVVGPVVGVLAAPNGLISYLFDDLDTLQRWLVLGSGVVLIVTLIANPDGIVGAISSRLRLRGRNTHRAAQRVEGAAVIPSSPHSALAVADLHVFHGNLCAVAGLNLVVEPGQIVGLIGPNGAGKTTAMDAISGFIPATAGSTRVGRTDTGRWSPHRRARAGLARSFQQLELFDDLTVAENLAVASEAPTAFDWVTCLCRSAPPHLSQLVLDAAERAGLDLGVRPTELAQGQRRYLGVLRALATNPSVVLLDEPAAGLDTAAKRELGQLLRETADTSRVGFLLVDHDMDLIGSICDRVIALDFGTVIFEGSANEVGHSAAVAAAYVGSLDEPGAASSTQAGEAVIQ